MWTRGILILACAFAASTVWAASPEAPGQAEVVSAPSPESQASPQGASAACDTGCDTPGTGPTRPWYFWWSSWCWWDRCHDRGQHYAYQPPLPGWYYFRPYSISQLRAQQQVVMQWGGDPRYPYGKPPSAATTDVIKWPRMLREPRFSPQRAMIEAPYRRDPQGRANPTAADYQDMINVAGEMKSAVGQMTAEYSIEECLETSEFLDQMAAAARRYSVDQARSRQSTALQSGDNSRNAYVNATAQQQQHVDPGTTP
jgi:hypothetical protein